MGSQASPALVIISAMITPALLILGSGSLVATALQRLGRVVDRARFLLQVSEADAQQYGWTEDERRRWLQSHAARSLMAERSVMAFFGAVGIFVADCLSIALDYYFSHTLTWLPVSLTIFGMVLMLLGAYFMLAESRLAASQIRDEIRLRK